MNDKYIIKFSLLFKLMQKLSFKTYQKSNITIDKGNSVKVIQTRLSLGNRKINKKEW